MNPTGDQSTLQTYDVCIVGAGAAGIYLASRLAARGKTVAVVEAGNSYCESPTKKGFMPKFLVDSYPGAIDGRAFGIGGTTSRWGGLLVPHTSHDEINDNGISSSEVWGHIVGVIRDNQSHVLKSLGFKEHAEFESFANRILAKPSSTLKSAKIETIASLFLPFRKKNLRFLLNRSTNNSRIHLFADTVATSWLLESESTARISKLVARKNDGSECTFQARDFVVAAGAIESARILLEIQDQHVGSLSMSQDIGKYLGDHLSLSIATVDVKTEFHRIKLFHPRFQGDWMRTFRFIIGGGESKRPAAFAHFIFENSNPGFLLAKEFLTAMQAKRFPSVSVIELFSGIGGIFRLALDRFVNRKLYVSKSTPSHLQLDMEQLPNPENRIELSDELDRFGRRSPAISWRISDHDIDAMKRIATTFIHRWNSCESLPRLTAVDLASDSKKPHDAYHPVGVCRMGVDAQSVVDTSLRVRGLNNLWCLSTGVFPTAGTANPTFSMLCLAEDLAKRL